MQTHQLIHSSKTNEWYTPARYIEAARQVMGGIDLDPASHELANQIVKATRFFDSSHSGLLEDWHGRVFLNPPYGKIKNRSNQEIWSTYLIGQYQLGHTTEAILLVNAVTDCKWFKQLWQYPIVLQTIELNSITHLEHPISLRTVIVLCIWGVNKMDLLRHLNSLGKLLQGLNRP